MIFQNFSPIIYFSDETLLSYKFEIVNNSIIFYFRTLSVKCLSTMMGNTYTMISNIKGVSESFSNYKKFINLSYLFSDHYSSIKS